MRNSKRILIPLGGACFLIVIFGLVATSGLFGPNLPEGTLPEQIDWLVDRAAEKQGMIGNVLVTRNGEQYYLRCLGYADIEHEIPNTPDTRFPIASVSKPITAILIMQLVEKGDLSVDSTLDSIFPNLRGKPAGAITIAQLLTHTSGVQEIIDRDPQGRVTPEDLESATVKSIAKFEYSSSGYVILALVIEKLTGLTYAEALEQYIFDPAGMEDSGVLRMDVGVEGKAKGYRLEDGEYIESPLRFAFEAVDGAGSIYSTTHDLWELAKALDDNTLISSHTRKLMEGQHVEGRFGYGWFLDEQGGPYYPWHVGGFDGYATAMAIQTHRREIVVILSNLEDTKVDQLLKGILRALKARAEKRSKTAMKKTMSGESLEATAYGCRLQLGDMQHMKGQEQPKGSIQHLILEPRIYCILPFLTGRIPPAIKNEHLQLAPPNEWL